MSKMATWNHQELSSPGHGADLRCAYGCLGAGVVPVLDLEAGI